MHSACQEAVEYVYSYGVSTGRRSASDRRVRPPRRRQPGSYSGPGNAVTGCSSRPAPEAAFASTRPRTPTASPGCGAGSTTGCPPPRPLGARSRSEQSRPRAAALPRPPWGRGSGALAILACAPDERHDIGLIAFGLLLRSHGRLILFLGADTPLAPIEEAVAATDP